MARASLFWVDSCWFWYKIISFKNLKMVGEGVKALVVDDEKEIVSIISEFFETVFSRADIVSCDGYRYGMEVLDGLDVPQVAVWDRGEIDHKPCDVIAEWVSRVRGHGIFFVISGDIPKGFKLPDSVSPSALSRFMFFYAKKPFCMTDLTRLVRGCMGFVLGGERVPFSTLPSEFSVIGGEQKMQIIPSSLLSEVTDDNFFDKLAGADCGDSVEFENLSDAEGWYRAFKSAFLAGIQGEMTIDFVCKVVDQKIGGFLQKIVVGKRGGDIVVFDVFHDLRNALQSLQEEKVGVGELREVKLKNRFLDFACEQFAILKKGFERDSFLEDMDVKVFFEPKGACKVDVPDGCKVTVPSGWMYAVLRNFVLNAERVAEERFWRSDVRVQDLFAVDVSYEDGFVIIKVSDNLPCFSDSDFRALFVQRMNSSHGSGRGLLIMARTVAKLGGSVCLRQAGESGVVEKKGDGTVVRQGVMSLPEGATKEFEIRLPMVRRE